MFYNCFLFKCCSCEAQIEPARKTCHKQHFYQCSGRQSSLWLHLWNQCHVLSGGVPAAQHDELPGRVLWLCGQHTGLLSAAHGGPLRICSLCLFTVSINILCTRHSNSELSQFIHSTFSEFYQAHPTLFSIESHSCHAIKSIAMASS